LCATKANSRTKSAEKPNCRRDEGGPLVAAVQAEATNHPLLLPLREVVVSEMGKRQCPTLSGKDRGVERK